MLVDFLIRKAGLDISINELETHAMAGGNVNAVVAALIAMVKAILELGFNKVIAWIKKW